MTQKKGTTLLLILSVTLLFLASFVVTTVRAPAGPSYTLGASPTTLNEEEGNVIITFAITGGTANTAYTFRFTVTKPGALVKPMLTSLSRLTRREDTHRFLPIQTTLRPGTLLQEQFALTYLEIIL